MSFARSQFIYSPESVFIAFLFTSFVAATPSHRQSFARLRRRENRDELFTFGKSFVSTTSLTMRRMTTAFPIVPSRKVRNAYFDKILCVPSARLSARLNSLLLGLLFYLLCYLQCLFIKQRKYARVNFVKKCVNLHEKTLPRKRNSIRIHFRHVQCNKSSGKCKNVSNCLKNGELLTPEMLLLILVDVLFYSLLLLC